MNMPNLASLNFFKRSDWCVSAAVSKAEAARQEAVRRAKVDFIVFLVNADAVITTRELVKMIKFLGIDISSLEPEPSDSAFSMRSSSGNLFGISGGHLEGLMRTIHFMMTGVEMSSIKISELRGLKNKKEARVKAGKNLFNIAAVSGLANAKILLDEIEAGRADFQIVEVMACPNGCINGGGQTLGADEKELKIRMKALYDVDDEEIIKVAHKNPIIVDLYDKFLAKPGSGHNMELLHVSRTSTDGK